jgi:hypothetical protein
MTYQLGMREELGDYTAVTLQKAELRLALLANESHVKAGTDGVVTSVWLCFRGAT